MKVLSLSDTLIPFIYSPQVKKHFCDVELVLSCGDLPYYYLEFVVSALNIPLYYVRGNHSKEVEYTAHGPRFSPHGGEDLHGKVINYRNLLLAGIEGCLRYREGPYQYTQFEMWTMVLRLFPALLGNKARYGRYLDVFVTHAPPWGTHDQPDLPHQGIQAFSWFNKVFQPSYHFHGHIHVYRPDEVTQTQVGKTLVINTFGYRETVLVTGGYPEVL
jgi:uncharacterized protein